MSKRKVQLVLAILANAALVVMECIAFPLLWKEHANLAHQAVFYTNQSNLLSLFVSAAFVVSGVRALFKDGRIGHIIKVLRLICTVQLYITFLVVAVLFVPAALGQGISLQAMYGGAMLFMHFLAPMVSLLSFLFLEGTPRLTLKDTLWGVLPTYLYTAVMVPLNALHIVDGPYPFLMVDENPLGVTLLYAVTLLPGAYLVSLCGKWLNNGIACRIAGEPKKERT